MRRWQDHESVSPLFANNAERQKLSIAGWDPKPSRVHEIQKNQLRVPFYSCAKGRHSLIGVTFKQ